MAERKTQKRIQLRNRINIEQPYEVKYWTRELGVSREELEQAVRAAGDHADQVRAHLEKTEHR
jgi:hypothetical protein